MKKIKLDENFPPDLIEIFETAGIDASSVLKQKISGIDDDNLYTLCIKEERVIVSFDLDFSNIIRYPADKTPGIIVCRIRKKMTLEDIKNLCSKLVLVIKSTELEGKLIIVEGNKIRIRKPEE
jgi:predicted nuclease of predicted toxin-antitoxin system